MSKKVENPLSGETGKMIRNELEIINSFVSKGGGYEYNGVEINSVKQLLMLASRDVKTFKNIHFKLKEINGVHLLQNLTHLRSAFKYFGISDDVVNECNMFRLLKKKERSDKDLRDRVIGAYKNVKKILLSAGKREKCGKNVIVLIRNGDADVMSAIKQANACVLLTPNALAVLSKVAGYIYFSLFTVEAFSPPFFDKKKFISIGIDFFILLIIVKNIES